LSIELPFAGTFQLSYWEKNGSSPWKLVQQNVTSNVVIGGGGLLIDEVRLVPAGTQLKTLTYKLGVGITSITDANNVVTYYEYDAAGRLAIVRDMNGDIIRTIEYKFKG